MSRKQDTTIYGVYDPPQRPRALYMLISRHIAQSKWLHLNPSPDAKTGFLQFLLALAAET